MNQSYHVNICSKHHMLLLPVFFLLQICSFRCLAAKDVLKYKVEIYFKIYILKAIRQHTFEKIKYLRHVQSNIRRQHLKFTFCPAVEGRCLGRFESSCFVLGALLPTTLEYNQFQWTEVPPPVLSQGLAPFPSALVPGEPPPPYSPQGSPDSSSAPVIACRVCQTTISVEGKTHQHVVKCSICNEATVSHSTSSAHNVQQWIIAFSLPPTEKWSKVIPIIQMFVFFSTEKYLLLFY